MNSGNELKSVDSGSWFHTLITGSQKTLVKNCLKCVFLCM